MKLAIPCKSLSYIKNRYVGTYLLGCKGCCFLLILVEKLDKNQKFSSSTLFKLFLWLTTDNTINLTIKGNRAEQSWTNIIIIFILKQSFFYLLHFSDVISNVIPSGIPDVIPKVEDDLMWSPMLSSLSQCHLCCPRCHLEGWG